MGGSDVIENLFVTGINFKNAGVATRGIFSLDREKKKTFLELAKFRGFEAVIVLNTCNRCEIYGIGSADLADELLCEVTGQSPESLQDYKFLKTAGEAIEHIFKVAAGLDSLILGDNEILGQFREACRESKQHKLLGAFFERMANIAIQTSKEIKNKTGISNGTMSVSFAAIQVISEKFNSGSLKEMKTLLIGAGNFGANVSRKLKTYFPDIPLTVANRTAYKAEQLSRELGTNLLGFDEIPLKASLYDIIIVCAESDELILTCPMFQKAGKKLILDLSMPRVTEISISELPGVELLTIDDISLLLNNTLENRKEFMPLAETMIRDAMHEFVEWYKVFMHKDKIQRVKKALMEISGQCPYLSKLEKPQLDKIMNKAMSELVQKLKGENFSEADVDQTISYFLKINHQTVEADR